MIVLGLLVIFFIIAAISVWIMAIINKRNAIKSHLQSIAKQENIEGVYTLKEMLRKYMAKVTTTIAETLDKFQLAQGKSKEISFLLSQAGYRSRNAILIYNNLRILSPILSSIIIYVWFALMIGFGTNNNLRLTIFMLGLLIGMMLPKKWLNSRINAYQTEIRKNLPDAIELMVICIESGYSNDSTIRRVAIEIMPECPEIAIEFDIVATELRMLPSRHEAWENFYARVEIPEVKNLISAMEQSEKFGAPLAKTLRDGVALMRKEKIARAEVRAGKIPILMIGPLMVFFLPLTVVLMLAPAGIKIMDQHFK